MESFGVIIGIQKMGRDHWGYSIIYTSQRRDTKKRKK